MMGLFSLLDVILEKPMEAAVKEVALDEQVRAALVDKAGDFYKVLDFIFAYEHANWEKVAIIVVQNNLELEDITAAFIEALVWYKTLLDAIGDEEEPEA
jgi:EAL and modified HD-GYP domain-containing signal transduction protein